MRLRAAAVVALICALGACSDDSEPDAEPEPTSTASASGAPSPTPSASPSGPVGELIEVRNVSLRAPITWTVEYNDAGMGDGLTMFPPTGTIGSSIHVYVSDNPSTYTLKDAADFALRNLRKVEQAPDARRLPRTTLDGATAYHVRGRSDLSHYDSFGAIHGGQEIYINFELDGTKAERQSIIDEVLNSVEWK